MNTDEIRAALAAATPGPWHAWDRGIGYEVHEGATHGESNGDSAWCRELNNEFRETFRSEDAHLIANAPTWLAELLAEVDLLRTLKHRHEQTVTELAARADAAEATVRRVRRLAEPWAIQPTDYDEDTEQQIEDGRAILRALDGGEQHG